MRIRVWSALAAVLLLAACGGPEPKAPAGKTESAPDTSNITISGDESDPVNKLAMQAIADLEQYWSQQYPALYNGDWQPVSGGFYAVSPSQGSEAPPCTSDPMEVSGNAFYCSTEDVVAWDAEGLLPDLQARFGDFVIPVILAHEYAHAVQARSNFTARTVTRELQSDCFAGAWSRHAQDDGVFDVNAADLDAALAGILELRDTPRHGQDRPERAR
jgi:predicted metalloprotease